MPKKPGTFDNPHKPEGSPHKKSGGVDDLGNQNWVERPTRREWVPPTDMMDGYWQDVYTD